MRPIKLDESPVPLHHRIAEYLLEMLKNGDLDPGERIPPEEELTGLFGVSRTTVRHALGHLLKKGLVRRKRGSGTWWTDAARTYRREKLAGANRQIFSITEKTTVKVLSKTAVRGSGEVTRFLRLPEGSEVIEYQRLRFTQGEPMSLTVNYLPPAIGESVGKRHLAQMTMLETLERVAGIRLGTIEHVVEITRASAAIAAHLCIGQLDPVLTIRTAVFDHAGEPVEIVWTYFVEDKYKFRVVLGETAPPSKEDRK